MTLLVREGVDTFHVYGKETTEGTKASSLDKNLGLTQSFSYNPNFNNVRNRGALGYLSSAYNEKTSRDVQSQLKGTFEGSISVGFQPSNFEFMEFVIGSASGTGTTIDPYFYPQESASTTADKLKYTQLPSLSWGTNSLWNGTGDSANGGVDLLGCKIGNCDIRAATGEPVSVSLTIPFMDFNPRNSLDTEVPIDSEDVYHFIGADVEIPTGTAVPNIIEDFSLSINNGVTSRHGLGASKPKKLFSGNRDLSLSLSLTNDGVSWLNDLNDFTNFATVTLKFAGDNGRTFEITLYECKLSDINVQGTHPNPVDEQINVYPEFLSCNEVTDAS